MKLVEMDRSTPDWEAWNTGRGTRHFPAITSISAAIIGGQNTIFNSKSLFDYFQSSESFLSPILFQQALSLNDFSDEVLGFDADHYIPFLIENEEQPWQRAALDGINLDSTAGVILRAANEILPSLTLASDYDECQWAFIASNGELKHIYLCTIGLEEGDISVNEVHPNLDRQAELLSKVHNWRKNIIEYQRSRPGGCSKAPV